MSTDIIARLRRIHAALGDAKSEDLSEVEVFFHRTERSQGALVDFNRGTSLPDLENVAFTLVANIASIKDHLKKWCDANGTEFGGEHLINTDTNVALVHDLWNTDKHAALTRSRSGHRPKLVDLQRSLRMSTGTNPGSTAAFTINMATGQPEFILTGGASRHLIVDGRIVNEAGEKLGDLLSVCEAAIDAWERELSRSGVQVP